MKLTNKIIFLNRFLETTTMISRFNSIHPIKIGIEEKDNFLDFTEYEVEANGEIPDETNETFEK